MSLEAQRIYLSNKFAAGDVGIPVAMPNQPFNIVPNTVYGEFHIVNGPKPVIIGGEGKGKVRARYPGFVQLTIWVPEEKGTKAATIAADKFKDIFQFKVGRDSVGQVYRFKTLQPYTPTPKAGYSCMVVRVPFHRDVVETVEIGA